MKWVGFASIAVAAGISACSGKVEIDPTGSGGGGDGGSGQGIDACGQAAAHIMQCIPELGTSSGTGAAVVCTGSVECQSQCVVAASCDALAGTDLQGSQDLGDCLGECIE